VARIARATLAACGLAALVIFGTGDGALAKRPSGTTLLFTFVTNQAGFDTGIVIANTSADPFGTTPEDGTCTLTYFGPNAPAPQPSGTIAAGKLFTTLASSSAPNFQGYLIAQCDFSLAHGFAFISDLGARNLAMSYLPLVLPGPHRKAGERLAN
jgi:hypothetical protein